MKQRSANRSIPRKVAGGNIPQLHTPNSVARLSGLDAGTIRKIARSGELPGVYRLATGSRLVFADEFLAALLRTHEPR